MLNLFLLGLGIIGVTSGHPNPDVEADLSPISSTPAYCLGPNLLFNSGFEVGSPFPLNWSFSIMAAPPPPTPPPPHVPPNLTQVESAKPHCGVDGSACWQIFWGSYPGTPAGETAISQEGYTGGFIGQQGKKYELSVAFRLEKPARNDANLTCWASTMGTVTPPDPKSYVPGTVVQLGESTVGRWHFRRGQFDGIVNGVAVNTVGCSLQFGPGGFDSVLDLDNIEVREKKC